MTVHKNDQLHRSSHIAIKSYLAVSEASNTVFAFLTAIAWFAASIDAFTIF